MMEKRKGFTLVELLVVIAIIALLMAILMPALNRVKNSARVLSCEVNAKQIGIVIASYQADNDGYVPLMRNRWALPFGADTALLSLAFRDYSEESRYELPSWIPSPSSTLWTWNHVLEYSQNHLLDFYVCPFVRRQSKAENWASTGNVSVCPGDPGRNNFASTGRMDSYATWIWPREKDLLFNINLENCYGPGHGRFKYANIVWHVCGRPLVTGCWANNMGDDQYLRDNPQKFTSVRKMGEHMAVYCAHGEIDDNAPFRQVYNYGSHEKMRRGGTNVIFADSHTEWIQGSQIGAGN